MKFSTNTLNEIKDRIPVSQVVGKKVQLKKKGREYVGLSPFNKEKTPSFTVNDEKQFYPVSYTHLTLPTIYSV